MDKIRAVLNKLVTNAYHHSEEEGSLVRHIDQALQEIKAELKGKLPVEKISCIRKMSSCGECHQCIEDRTFNACLKQVLKIIEEL